MSKDKWAEVQETLEKKGKVQVKGVNGTIKGRVIESTNALRWWTWIVRVGLIEVGSGWGTSQVSALRACMSTMRVESGGLIEEDDG